MVFKSKIKQKSNLENKCINKINTYKLKSKCVLIKRIIIVLGVRLIEY